jgi:hypothetical protein
MGQTNPPVLDLITFHALKGEDAAGYRVFAKQKNLAPDVWTAWRSERTWCRACAIVEAVYRAIAAHSPTFSWTQLAGGVLGSAIHNSVSSKDILAELVGEDDGTSPYVIALANHGRCDLCGKIFGHFPTIPPSSMQITAPDPHRHDTWRKKNRWRIR